MTKRATSTRGIHAIELREGIRFTVYRDSKGLPTVGVGHLIVSADKLKVGDKITPEQCDAFLAQDLKVAEDAVNTLVTVPLAQNQFDALVSFVINIGVGQKGFKGSTVVKRLNVKDYTGAANALMFWVKPSEIKGRRRTEQKQFLTPDAVEGPALPSAPVDNPIKAHVTITVGAGDTLWKLAIKYQTTIPALKSLNGLTSDLIKIGQELKI